MLWQEGFFICPSEQDFLFIHGQFHRGRSFGRATFCVTELRQESWNE
jgi:hypothetical protein